jgi:hypothetical protein
VAEGLDFFKQGAIASGGRLSQQETCPLRKKILVGWLSGR